MSSLRKITGVCIIAFILAGCEKDDSVIPIGDDDDPISFMDDVLPILSQHGCVSCHGPSLSENGLRVDAVSELLMGGNSGAAIVPGNSGASLLIQKMSANPPFGERMPLDRSPVPDAQQNIIRQWIDQGAQGN